MKIPITDDHIHIDPVNGRGTEAAKDFMRAGGTHLFLVSKPSGSFGIHPEKGEDYIPVFDGTLKVAAEICSLGIVVNPILGVHPAEITRLSAVMSVEEAASVMMEGLDLAAGYVEEGDACCLKSGRPHYEVSPDLWTASNTVLSHAFTLGAELECAVQVHAETGPCADMVAMAKEAGMDPGRVVKHYGSPDTPLIPSLLARHPEIPDMCREKRKFTMESDYMDENSRPGAVIGPKSVPRFTLRLLSDGLISEDDAWQIHAETPSAVYGVEITL